MTRQVVHYLAIAAAILFSGCSGSREARSMEELDFGEDVPALETEILRQAPAASLFAVNPDWPRGDAERTDPARFHGHEILGRAVISEPKKLLSVLDLVARACCENDDTVAACFSPRHGVRVDDGESVVDLLVCFECLQIKVFRDGAVVGGGCIGSTLEPEVSTLYRSVGLPIASR